VHAGGDVFAGDRIASDRLGADQRTVERAHDPKIVCGEILASVLDAFILGVGGDHMPYLALHSTPNERPDMRQAVLLDSQCRASQHTASCTFCRDPNAASILGGRTRQLAMSL
jgi:hypothetical protein